MVAQGYTQEEGIDYDEVFAPVARIEAIRLFLAYASCMGFIMYKMDVKSAFSYGTIEVEVDDIIFGSTKKSLCDEFEGLMHKRFQMSSMGELTFFLGLQVQQKEDGIFISQDKYVAKILKKFNFATVKTTSTLIETNKELVKDEEAKVVDVHLYSSMIGSLMYLTASRPDIMFAICACARFQATLKMSHLHAVKRIFRYLKGQPKLGLWYPKDSTFDLEVFSDSDYARASLDRKSTIRGCQFLVKRLISWQCKKQTIVANSTTEAEYVAAANCYGQVLGIQNQMLDYGFNFINTMIYIDNESTICIVKNPVFHFKTKHIEIRHNFIRDSYEKSLIQVIKIHTDHNVADLLTKAFDVSRFNFLVASIEKKELVIPRQMTTGKEFSNPLMAGSLSKTISAKFWNTTTSKIVNSVKQIHAIVDGKAVVILESPVRNELFFDDEDGITCLINDEIFENLALMGTRSERVLEKPNEPPLLEGHTFGSGDGSIEHTFELMDTLPPAPHDSPLTGGYTPKSDEGRLKLKKLMAMCTKLSKQVLDLEKEKDAQAVEILKLKKRIESFDDDLDEDDASKQRRKSDKTKSMFKDSDFDVLNDDMENIEGETVNTATIRVSVVSAPVTTAGVAISTAEPRTPPTTAETAFIDEDLTIAQTLVKMRSEKAKVKGVAFRDVEETPRLTRSATTLQPLPTIDPKDKGKGVLVEEEPEKPEKVKRRVQGLAQIESDAELAQRLHEEELAELDRAQKEKQKQEEATNATLAEEFDEIQARIDADHELVVRLTHEEQEKYTIEERATLFAEYFERRKKQLSAERAEAIRNKPSTRAQVRNMMITYLKHMESNEEAATYYEQEKEELRMWLVVVRDEDETVDPEIMSVKYPIVDWEYQNLGSVDMEDIHVYKIIRADGNTSYQKTFSSMMRKFNRQDLMDLHRLVMKRNVSFIEEMLKKMLNWKLKAEAKSTMAFELLKFINFGAGLLGNYKFDKLSGADSILILLVMGSADDEDS
ncbi:putative ribonuclease H-like domain-containing protein [Tanacetum coccineum]|uniref:Ribonuclease H-like domain-containing protein n=1 Tax=Tanacetum coccineum TaxID=301880 RepID=A0ABQ4YYF3_9ASTR